MKSNQFHRTELLFGKDGLTKLKQAHLAVIGCGAVGGFAVEALARTGIGRITLIDGDTVDISNINRQICATYSTLNKPKVDILKKRVSDINPDITVITHNEFLTEENTDTLLKTRPDFVIDAIDTVKDKVSLILWLQKNKIPFLSSMGAACKTDWRQIKVAPLKKTSVCPLASRIRKLLKEKNADMSFPCVFSTETAQGRLEANRQMGSLITITAQFGLILAHEVIQRIINNNE